MKSYLIVVKGVNLDRLVNQLSRQFELKSVCRYDCKMCSLTVSAKDRQKIVDYLRQRCYTNYTIKPLYLTALLLWFKRNIVLSILTLCLVIAVAVCSRLCLLIKIDYSKDEQSVAQALQEYGITRGSFLGDLDIDKLENYLCNKLDCAYAIVEPDGCVLSIDIIDKLTQPAPIDYNQPHDIVSKHDAVVTRVALINGTSAVNVGDTVTQGQVLIVGLRTFTDGTTQPTFSLGQVFGKVTMSLSEAFTPSQVTYQRTNNQIVHNSIGIFGLNWQSNYVVDYEHFESVTETYQLSPLNIVVTSTTVYELEPYNYTVTLEEVLDSTVERLIGQLIEQADFEFDNFTYSVDNDIITVTASAEILISTD